MARGFDIKIQKKGDFDIIPEFLQGTVALDILMEDVMDFSATTALEMVQNRIRRNEFEASTVSPVTRAILQARQLLSGPREITYPSGGNITQTPLLRNRDLLNSFRIYKSGKQVVMGIHGNKKAINGWPMSDIARHHEFGYKVLVTKELQNFLILLKSVAEEEFGADNVIPAAIPIMKVGQVINVPARPLLGPISELFTEDTAEGKQFENEMVQKGLDSLSKVWPKIVKKMR